MISCRIKKNLGVGRLNHMLVYSYILAYTLILCLGFSSSKASATEFNQQDLITAIIFHDIHHHDCAIRAMYFEGTGIVTAPQELNAHLDAKRVKNIATWIQKNWSKEKINAVVFWDHTPESWRQGIATNNISAIYSKGHNMRYFLDNEGNNATWSKDNEISRSLDNLVTDFINDVSSNEAFPWTMNDLPGLYSLSYGRANKPTGHATNFVIFKQKDDDRIFFSFVENQDKNGVSLYSDKEFAIKGHIRQSSEVHWRGEAIHQPADNSYFIKYRNSKIKGLVLKNMEREEISHNIIKVKPKPGPIPSRIAHYPLCE